MSDDISINTEVIGGAAGLVGVNTATVETQTIIGTAIYNFASPPAPPTPTAEAGPIPLCPYPGLAYFDPQKATQFFGRERAIQALVATVAKRSFTALVGASGTGKSSVVLAGLWPRLVAQGSWRSTYFRIGTEPDKNPFAALARALEPLTGERGLSDKLEEVQKLGARLAEGSINLTNVVAQCRVSNPGKRILLIADQFEEVFTLVSNDGLRNRFIDTLIAAFPDPSQGASPDICLVLTLRADFYNAALRYRPLADRLQDNVENLGPMMRDELREAVEKPAKALQVEFEPGLVDAILDDVEKRPGSLPLLQFALREMWGQLKALLMTRADYDALRGVEGALAKRAQTIFAEATANETDTAAVGLFRRLFTRLVTLGEGAEDTRRIVEREELGQDAWGLAQRLADEDNRLVVTTTAASGQETAEVVHEALIRGWPRLVEWINRDRDFQSWVRRLKPRVDEWRAHPSDDGTMLRGGTLAVADEWVARRGNDLATDEKAFVAKSIELRDAEKRRAEAELEEKEARLREVAKAQEKTEQVQRRRQRAQAFVGILLAAMAVGAAAWLYQDPLREKIKEESYALANVTPLEPARERALKPGDTLPRECTHCPEMIVVPARSFRMGSRDGEGQESEQPLHWVTIAKPFAVAKFPVTFDEWNACHDHGDCPSVTNSGWRGDGLPAGALNWDDAQTYVKWLSKITGKHYRLLSEAEYEYAARGGRETVYPWGDEITLDGRAMANCDGCRSQWGKKQTSPVDLFPPNRFGLYDMVGNVWEWTEDCWNESYHGAPADGSPWTSGDCSRRVVRGGSWNDPPSYLPSAHRRPTYHEGKNNNCGLRVARVIVDEAATAKPVSGVR